MEFIERILYNILEVHPLHTLMVHFPVALTGAALFFILLAFLRNSEILEQAAFANIALAMAGTLAAGVTGWLDNREIYEGAAPNANVKIILAGLLFGLTLLVTASRWKNPGLFRSKYRFIYFGGYLTSFAIVAVLGFLGGVILYGFEEKPGTLPVIPDTGQGPDMFQPVAATALATEAGTAGVSFSAEIFPILKSRCVNCHGGNKTEEGLNMTSYDDLMAGSENGPVVIPGDSTNSSLATSLVERKMPKRGPKLSPEMVQLILRWIDEGAPDN